MATSSAAVCLANEACSSQPHRPPQDSLRNNLDGHTNIGSFRPRTRSRRKANDCLPEIQLTLTTTRCDPTRGLRSQAYHRHCSSCLRTGSCTLHAIVSGPSISKFSPLDIDSTATLDSAYRLLAALRVLVDWLDGEFGVGYKTLSARKMIE